MLSGSQAFSLETKNYYLIISPIPLGFDAALNGWKTDIYCMLEMDIFLSLDYPHWL